MQEVARKTRNEERLQECYLLFARKVKAVISDMEESGFRPRIQDAYRNPADQLKDFRRGTSTVEFGFHNVTGQDSSPESLAVDLIDDDNPLASGRRYVITLAHIAAGHGLRSGIFFNSGSEENRAELWEAIANLNFDPKIKIGFDPTHLEATGLSIDEAHNGKRPA